MAMYKEKLSETNADASRSASAIRCQCEAGTKVYKCHVIKCTETVCDATRDCQVQLAYIRIHQNIYSVIISKPHVT